MAGGLRRRIGLWPALAMIVAEVMGVGILLTPAGMARTLGEPEWVLAIWLIVGVLSVAGALCYAELGTRFPEAGGGYVFLREAFGARCAFVYGWMMLLVLDPGLTAALGVGLAQYLLVAVGGPAAFAPPVAIATIVVLGAVSVLGLESSARVLRWAAAAKLAIIGLLVLAVVLRGDTGGAATGAPAGLGALPPVMAWAGALMGAFFAFGGWWDLGKMSEEVVDPRRTLPLALVGGIALVACLYAGLTVAFMHVLRGQALVTDEAFVAALGVSLFGRGAGHLLAVAVVIAVAGSLAAVLLGAPRVYLAMARTGVFPPALVRFDARRQAAPGATLVQVTLASALVLLGSFDQILGYFVPAAVFFLGLSASAILVLPRPAAHAPVFVAPWHPLPIAIFLVLVVTLLVLFTLGRPWETLTGAAVIALGIPVSWVVAKPTGASSHDTRPAPPAPSDTVPTAEDPS